MSVPTISFGYLVSLTALVATGAVVPVVPTSAAVSVAGALAEKDGLLLVVLVVAFGAAGAYISDLATYALVRVATRRAVEGSGRFIRWLHDKRHGKVLARLEHRFAEHDTRVVLLSRVVPGSQMPVLLTAAIGGYPWRRYAMADIGAVVLWASMYTASGVAGRAVFAAPWQGAAAGIAVVVALTLASAAWSRRRARRRSGRPPSASPGCAQHPGPR